jgi:hypothetical protein
MNETQPPSPLSVPVPPQRCGLALASLILGIAGLVLCLGPLAGIPAVICGHIAMSRISKSGGSLAGNGLALAGLITGYVAIVMIAVIGLLAAIAIPNFVKARRAAQEQVIRAEQASQEVKRARQAAQKAACIMNLRAIEGATATWALENKKRSGDVPTDEDLFGPTKYIRKKPSCPARGIYTLNRVDSKPTCSIPDHKY